MLQDYPNTQLFIDGEWRDSLSKETLEDLIFRLLALIGSTKTKNINNIIKLFFINL